jgi:hypothetical protein
MSILGSITNFLKPVGSFLTGVANPVLGAVSGVLGVKSLLDNKDSGNISSSPTFLLDTNPASYKPPPLVDNTVGASNFTDFMVPQNNNTGSATSLIPRFDPFNQDNLIETNKSSIGNLLQTAPNIIGLGAQIAKRVAPFFGFGSGQNLKIPQIGDIVDVDQDQLTFNTPRTPMFEEFTQLINPMTPQIQQQGAGFMSPILGRLRLTPKGTLIITRKMRSQFKALADNVGLAQASNLAGVPLEIGAMILTKRFPMRSKSISTKKMRDCARTYKQITNFYNMIPKRTATRKASTRSMRGASTVIQNS